MADDALFPMRTAPIGPEIDPLIGPLGWSKADLGRFLGASRQTVSRWARGKMQAAERNKAAIRFLRRAALAEREKGDLILLRGFGEWALPLGIRGLLCARLEIEILPESGPLGQNLRGEGPVLSPARIKKIRKELGWIQAEMATFFGVTHSTPSKWEDPRLEDPGIGPAAEAELLALGHLAGRRDPSQVRDLWQEGVSGFMTETLGWEVGILPKEYL